MLRLARVFGDGAVLQRDKTIPVWGWADGDARLTAEMNGQTVYAIAASTGSFIVRFPCQASGGPHTLTIRNESTGEEVMVKDILIGEVWICSGQSNMEYALGSSWCGDSASARASARAGVPTVCERQCAEFFAHEELKRREIRFFRLPMTATGTEELDCAGAWADLTYPDGLSCTAVGAWFGLRLHQELDVPVGLLFTAYGGTIVEAWTSRSALAANPHTADMIPALDRIFLAKPREHTALEMADCPIPGDSGNEGFGWGWASPDFDDSDWTSFRVPGSWKAQKIGGNGAVWARRTVTIPEEWSGYNLQLNLGGIDKTDIAYFNGVEIGRTGGDLDETCWSTPRHYPVPADLVSPGRAVIAVRMYSFICDGSMNGSSKCFSLRNPATGETMDISGQWRAAVEKETGDLVAAVPQNLSWGRGNPNTPSILFDCMIRPLIPYAVRGAIWYQGESNAWSLAETDGYASKLESMVADWRRAFQNPDMPLIQVELAAFRESKDFGLDDAWPGLREEQQRACKEMRGVYLVSAIDVGEPDDIHPQDKKTPGFRLAASALNHVYGRHDITPHGPELIGHELNGSEVILHFAHSDGLEFRCDPFRGFFVADANRIFRPADEVEIRGMDVVIRSRTCDVIMAVRYAWADNPPLSLYNGAGYPASPFRTDP